MRVLGVVVGLAWGVGTARARGRRVNWGWREVVSGCYGFVDGESGVVLTRIEGIMVGDEGLEFDIAWWKVF